MLGVMRSLSLKLLNGISNLPACCMASAYLVCPGWPQDAPKSDLPFIRVEPVSPRPLGPRRTPRILGIGFQAEWKSHRV